MNKRVGVACICVIFSFSVFFGNLNTPLPLPHGLHAWAQADRFALASNYFNEDRGFFDPATYSVMSQNGDTGVEFPLLPYISALLGTSQKSVAWWFRILSALVVILSITEWSRLTLPNRPKWTLFLPYLMFLGSSSFLFYAFSFIPDLAALGFALVGMAHAVAFHKKKRLVHAFVAVAFFVLAALTKVSAGMYLLLFLLWLLVHYKQYPRRQLVGVLISSLVGIALIFSYDYFLVFEKNKSLWAVVFMSSPNPIGWNDVIKSFKDAAYWFPQVLSFYTLPLVFVLCILGIVRLNRRFNTLKTTLVLGVPLLGFIGFWVLFGRQFGHHDYYWLASYLPGIWGLMWFGSNQALRKPLWLLPLAALAVGGAVDATYRSNRAHNDEFKYRKGTIVNRTKWMLGGAESLDSMGISRDATIFVLYDFAPNLALSHFDRKGIVFNHEQMARNEEHLKYWVDRIQPDYYLLHSKWQGDLQKDQPFFSKELQPVERIHDLVILKRNH
jgi:hypothetical protein